MIFKKLCLVVTDRCTAACDFCGFSCGPDRQHVMPEALMARMIREAAEMGVNSISFSGGEPFLYPELLVEGARLAREAKMKVNIASNGFWGAWDEARSKEWMEKIKPDSFSFSYDSFHKKYVSEEAMIRALKVLYDRAITPRVYVADMRGDYSGGRFIQSLDKSLKYGTGFVLSPAYRCGRAMNLPEEMFLTEDHRQNIRCLYDNTVSVLFNGDVYPCCRFQAFDSQLKLGNVEGKSLKTVIAQSDVPEMCDVMLNSERFNRLLDLAVQEGIAVEEKAGCSCDYCRMLFGTPEKREKMRPHVKALYGEMLVASLLREVEKNDQ